MKKGEGERKRSVLWSDCVPVIRPYFPCFRGSSQSPQLLAAPHCRFWGQMLLPFLSLALLGPAAGSCLCLKLPLASFPRAPGFQKHLVRDTGEVFISSSHPQVKWDKFGHHLWEHNYIHTYAQHPLKYGNTVAHKFTYSFKEGRRKVAGYTEALFLLPFASATWWASLKELCWFLSWL